MATMNITFPHGKPLLTPPDKGESPWTLADDWAIVADGATYELHQGFQTDGASIPRLLWRICGTPLAAPRLYAALVHDAAYLGRFNLTRKEADALFRDIQIALGVPAWKARLEYYALRICGGSHWAGGRN